LNATLAPFTEPLTSRSRGHGNVEAPCPDQRPQRKELGNIACALPVEFWHLTNCENRCVTLLRNSNTQHSYGDWKVRQLHIRKSLPCQNDSRWLSQYSSMSVGASMRLRSSTKSALAHSRARRFSAWKKIDAKKPLDILWGMAHLMTRTPFADTGEPD
jgi:hypothetical protein